MHLALIIYFLVIFLSQIFLILMLEAQLGFLDAEVNLLSPDIQMQDVFYTQASLLFSFRINHIPGTQDYF